MTRKSEEWVKFAATRVVGLAVDTFILALAYAGAIALRFDFHMPRWGWRAVALCFVTVWFFHIASLVATGCYSLSWRRSSLASAPRYVAAMFFAALALTVLRAVLPTDAFSHIRPPYSITVMCFFLSTAGVLSARWLWRAYWESRVKVEELLRREVKTMDNAVAARFLSGKTVMVTGAGGTIGSETVRQAFAAGAKRVLLVERGENALYEIRREMDSTRHSAEVVPLMHDAGDEETMRRVFGQFRPEVVIHAAAYKHVPMVEENPDEGWRNNVEATKTLASLAKEQGVERFVLISTDKAVNPVSVMGKTKLAAEKAVMELNEDGRTSFCAVRFGNVLGSSGSVVPLFRELISKRRPLTVTHPDMQRYFMTVGEAVSLVLQAASRSERAIYTLDMGKPVKILDLAEKMISQAGFRPYVDIPIVFTGVRPGEKIAEELDISEKSAYKTDMAKIYITKALLAAACLFALPAASLADDDEGMSEEKAEVEAKADGDADGENPAAEETGADSFAPYQKIIDRQMFGSPPPNFDPNMSPADVKAVKGKGAAADLSPEQQQLQKSVKFTVLNLNEKGEAHVGFSDYTDQKLPKHYYLKVGEKLRGWTVLEADVLAGTAAVEKDGIRIELSLGQQSTGASKSDTPAAPMGGGLAERRRARELAAQRELERLNRERAQEAAENAAEKAKMQAEIDEQRAVTLSQLSQIQESLDKFRAEKAAEKAESAKEE